MPRMAKFKLRDRVMKVGEWAIYTVHEIIVRPGAEAWYSLQKDAKFSTARESELEAEPVLRTSPLGKAKGRKVGKVPRPRKVKQVTVHGTRRARALKKDHNPKSKGIERKRMRGM
jgi:hypothetical protein